MLFLSLKTNLNEINRLNTDHVQPKNPLFTSDSQHPPRSKHAVHLGGNEGSEQNAINCTQSLTLDAICCLILSRAILLTLNAPITTKVVCFSRLLKCLRSLDGKQYGHRSDCWSSLFWVHAVCFYLIFQ